MKWKTHNWLILVVLLAALMFFGTAFWMIVQRVTSERARWMFDIFSAFLFISIFFWLLFLEDSVKGGN
jgi:hypothetical protein